MPPLSLETDPKMIEGAVEAITGRIVGYAEK
jgi:hypothetical protein